MSRLIDADKFLSQIEDQYMEHDITREKYMDLEDRIMQQPTIEERKTGKWKEHEKYPNLAYLCSECGYFTTLRSHFCPNCGADMRGEAE